MVTRDLKLRILLLITSILFSISIGLTIAHGINLFSEGMYVEYGIVKDENEYIIDYFDNSIVVSIDEGDDNTSYDKIVEFSDGNVSYLNINCENECVLEELKASNADL